MKILMLLLFLLPCFCYSQNLEIGTTIGTSFYEGDLSTNTIEARIRDVNIGLGVFSRVNINNYLTAKVGINYGKVEASDANSNIDGRNQRNLSFQSNLFELSLTGEINILGYQPFQREKIFSPYLFGGIALFHFNPKTNYQGQLIALQPLGTEGQGLTQYPERQPYNLTQFAIPFGGGLKLAINESWNLGIELGFRITFTDYLDDVSTIYIHNPGLLEARGSTAAALADRSTNNNPAGTPRGSSENNDWYIFSGITFSYNFSDMNLFNFGSSKKRLGCPTF